MNLLSLWQKSQPPLMAAHLTLANEHTPNHTHAHLPHGTNILLVPLWLLHPKAINLQKTHTASREEDLPGGATKGRDATNFGNIVCMLGMQLRLIYLYLQ